MSGMGPPIAFLRARAGDEWVDSPNPRLDGKSPAELVGEDAVDMDIFIRVLNAAVEDGIR
jgi:hypothetical protein